ncbi:MAG: hypothetical protein UR61_C0053G0004 [candidate division WS6 bacterium GW2011_GWE1_34_7]|uniref:Uncharacterized protein n=1 Tax=candidate division WS6 bacterium GW2011_GWE1_34_7 TaxID=1619093 RepID=A0A0G0E9V6_9BACT|nr:MAG: hypothetical protein UR61_C0053G0004 [candidate division WS6 bacterium GW2011_GWE1_34_7]
MAVGEFEDLKKFEQDIGLAGSEVINKGNLSSHILPTVRRFERLSSIFFRNKFSEIGR